MIKILLTPLSWLYGGIAAARHKLYDKGILPSVSFDLPVICVGNLTVGGTGKTPHVEYLVRLLSPSYKTAVLSRGYKRKTKGFVLADESATPASIGDEPAQIWMKFKPETTVAVGEERALAIPHILMERSDTELVLMDDGFQHRAVQPSLSIVLCNYYRPFFDDLPLPAGRLRDRRTRAGVAQIIIATKCPDDMKTTERDHFEQSIHRYAPEAKVFFTGIRYLEPVPIGSATWSAPTHAILLSGIANPDHFESYWQQRISVLKHFRFGDHHHFTASDFEAVSDTLGLAPSGTVLICTEKDAVRMNGMSEHDWQGLPAFYLPIEAYFLEGQKEFDQHILDHVQTFVTTPMM